MVLPTIYLFQRVLNKSNKHLYFQIKITAIREERSISAAQEMFHIGSGKKMKISCQKENLYKLQYDNGVRMSNNKL
jgi:hypothetical protein